MGSIMKITIGDTRLTNQKTTNLIGFGQSRKLHQKIQSRRSQPDSHGQISLQPITKTMKILGTGGMVLARLMQITNPTSLLLTFLLTTIILKTTIGDTLLTNQKTTNLIGFGQSGKLHQKSPKRTEVGKEDDIEKRFIFFHSTLKITWNQQKSKST